MRIIIDGSPDKIKVSVSARLADVLAGLQDYIDSEDRILLGAKLDGKDLTDDLIADNAAKEITSFESLVVNTLPRPALAANALAEAMGLLDSLARDHDEMAVGAIRGLGRETEESVQIITEKWQLVSDTLLDVPRTLFGHRPELVEQAASVLVKPLEKLGTNLKNLAEAIKIKDFVLAADIVKYRLTELTAEFDRITGEIGGIVGARPEGDA